MKTMTEQEFKKKCKDNCEYCKNNVKYRCPLMPKEFLTYFNNSLGFAGIKFF